LAPNAARSSAPKSSHAANKAVVCRHRGGKRIGVSLETSDKDVHEKLPVLRSPTIEDCQSTFAESGSHIPEMEKIWSLRIAGASQFADTGVKDVALRSINSNYGVTLLPDKQRKKALTWRSGARRCRRLANRQAPSAVEKWTAGTASVVDLPATQDHADDRSSAEPVHDSNWQRVRELVAPSVHLCFLHRTSVPERDLQSLLHSAPEDFRGTLFKSRRSALYAYKKVRPTKTAAAFN
jgi:hypothetical protein